MSTTSPFYLPGANIPPGIETKNDYPFGSNPFVSITPPLYDFPLKNYRKHKRRTSGDALLSINTDYSEPLVSIHEDFHNDEELQHKLSKTIYYKILDKWLYGDFSDLLKYFVKGDRSKKINKTEIIRKIEDSDLITKKKVKKMIAEYIEEKDINWDDLYEKEESLKRFLKKKLKKLFKRR